MNTHPLSFISRSLIARLVISFFLLAMITVVAASLLAYSRAKAALAEAVFERLTLSLDLKGSELLRWVADQEEDVLLISQMSEVRSSAATLIRQGTDREARSYRLLSGLFGEIQQQKPTFKEILLLSLNGGQVIFSTDPTHEGDYRARDTFFIEGRKATYMQSVYPWPVTLQPTMTVATPLYNNNGEQIGVLVVHLNLDFIDNIVNESADSKTSAETYLVDKYNVFVSSKRFGREKFPRGVHTEGIDKAVLLHLDGVGLYRSYDGTEVVGAYQWIAPLELALIAESDQAEAFRPAAQLGLFIFYSGLLLSIFLAVATYFLARQIARPILAITQAAQAVSQGNQVLAPVSTQDEIGMLARSFNKMTSDILSLYHTVAEREEDFRQLFQHSPNGILIAKSDGTLLRANAAMGAIMGCPEAALMDKLAALNEPNDLASLLNLLRETEAGAEILNREQVLTRADGTEIPVQVSLSTMPNGNIQVIYTDISELKRAQAEIQKFNEVLEARVLQRTAELKTANDALESFSYSVSHDLRAPLRGVNAYAHLLKADHAHPLQPTALEYVDKITASANQMGLLIDSLLAFARLGRSQLNKEKIELTPLVHATITTLAAEIENRPIEWAIAELPPAQADPALIQQVLVNLIGNAIKYTRMRQPARIEIGYMPPPSPSGRGSGGEGVIYFVRDNGAGFDMQHAGKLFGVFQRLHRQDEFEGTGIGLATVQRIIQRHGGRIWAEAEPDKGATFYFTLGADPEP